MIEGTALVQRMTVVTRNTADFEACGADLLNPWEMAGPWTGHPEDQNCSSVSASTPALPSTIASRDAVAVDR